jgi:hypothetical protein
MKKVLLLGDSIRLSYHPLVREKLSCRAEVTGPEDNCRFTKYTLWYIKSWLDQFGKPDIIHWNNGLWDVYHFNEDTGIFTPKEEYLTELGRILTELRKTGAVIIWASTTPVTPRHGYCRNKDIDEYNGIASEFMKSEGIEINDLNSLLRNNIEGFICEDNIHLNADGREVCANAVAKAIESHL